MSLASDEEEDLDDVPLSLPFGGGSHAHASNGSAAAGSRLPGLALGRIPESIFAGAGGLSCLQAVGNSNDEDGDTLDDPCAMNGGSRDMELSFNAIKSATPERYEEPLPSSRHPPPSMLGFRLNLPSSAAAAPPPASARHAPSPDHSMGVRQTARPKQHAEAGKTSAFASPLQPSAHSSPPPPAPHGRSTTSLPGTATTTSGRVPDPSVIPPAPSLAHLKTMKPPRLHLENPATASPVMSPMHPSRVAAGSSGLSRSTVPAGVSVPPGLSLTEAPGQSAGGKRLFVSLLSPAFSLPLSSLSPTGAPAAAAAEPTGATGAAAPHHLSGLGRLARTSASTTTGTQSPPFGSAATGALPSLPAVISSTLGIQASALQCFTLNEVPWEHLGSAGPAAGAGGSGAGASSGSSHVAVLVEGSSFNLASLEEMLRSNQQLLSTQETHAKTIASLQADFKAAAAAREEHAVRTAQLEKDLEFALARARMAEAEATELKTQLQQCDEQRLQLGGMLAGLRAHFDQCSRGWFEAIAAAASRDAGAAEALGEVGQGGAQGSVGPGGKRGAGGALEAELRRMSLEVAGLPSPPAASGAQTVQGLPPLRTAIAGQPSQQ